ncbi:MAG TPA: branched-chain amino acid ABC transporter permease, partial [Actinobacteria bacterium]|nr:branched-chain amino acid ABC transporter permease [Actinomycetota bacterium]
MAIATGIYHTKYSQDLALRQTRADWVRLLVLIAFLGVVPFVASSYWLTIL